MFPGLSRGGMLPSRALDPARLVEEEPSLMHPFAVEEVRCRSCGHPNFPPAQAWLRTRATRYCGQCGANLFTGERDAGTLVHHHGALAAAFVFSALIGAFAGTLLLQFIAWALFSGTYFAPLAPHAWLAGMVLGAVAGIALVERNRRRGGFSGPKSARSAERENKAAIVFVAVWIGGIVLSSMAERMKDSPGLLALGGIVFLGGLVYALVRARRARKAPPDA